MVNIPNKIPPPPYILMKAFLAVLSHISSYARLTDGPPALGLRARVAHPKMELD